MKNNIYGIGTDIIEVERIHTSLKNHPEKFLASLFQEEERAYFKTYAHPLPHIAGHFAAKEAIAKALGCGFGKDLAWLDITITHTQEGKPLVSCTALIASGKQIHLSISHIHLYAVAFAVVELLN